MIIIGVSGKKQAGKNTLCDDLKIYFETKLCYSCKVYSFADALKEKICMGVMGLTIEQCYGDDEQKNSLTQYKWENLPHQIRYDNKLGCEYASNGEVCQNILPTGFMTAREIMQVVGTDIFRKYFDDSIWVNATFKNIKKDRYDAALISDVRFPSEVKGVIEEGGNIIRLLRNICGTDEHSSETVLDNYDFSIHGSRVYLIDNNKMTIKEQKQNAIKYVKELYVKEIDV